MRLTRNIIENCGRCDWFDLICPNCGKMSFAYQGTLVEGDYALLCQNVECKNFFRVASLVDIFDKIIEEDYINLDKQ